MNTEAINPQETYSLSRVWRDGLFGEVTYPTAKDIAYKDRIGENILGLIIKDKGSFPRLMVKGKNVISYYQKYGNKGKDIQAKV